MTRDRNRGAKPPLDAEALERAALSYAGRYATTRARLAAYLRRKLHERGWDGGGQPPVEALTERMAELGYVDDGAVAAGRAAALSRRGFGARRVAQALRAAGISEEDGLEAWRSAREEGWTAALRFAERRKIGPFAAAEPDRAAREKALAAMIRAGHPMEMARRIVAARAGEIPQADGD